MNAREKEHVEELCEEIWSLTEMGENTLERVTGGSKLDSPAAALEELIDRGLVRVASDRVTLTDSGAGIGRTVVRRHRLAEVLFTQVLAVEESLTESTACEVEHILSEEVTDSICTYLGHPPSCPHGKPIPRGRCCEIFLRDVRPLVVRLSDLQIGESGRIVFIAPGSHSTLERVAALGVVPGRPARLLQKHPSVVFETGQTTLAVDSEIAAEIFVRRNGG